MTIGSRRKPPTSLTAIVAVLSLAVHGALALLVSVADCNGAARVAAVDTTSPLPGDDEVVAATAESVMPSCQVDATLAAWGRAAVCASPLAPTGCFAELDRAYESWLGECNQLLVDKLLDEQREKEPVRIALADESMLDKLEPLQLEELLAPAPTPVVQPEVQPQPPQPQPEAQPPKPEPPQPRPMRSAQVVEITPPEKSEPPKNARFVSEYDSSTEREKVARGSTEEMVNRPAPKELPVADKQKVAEERKPPAETAPPKPKPEIENDRGTGKLDMRRPGEREELARKPANVGDPDGRKDPLSENGLAAKHGERARRWRERKLTRNPRGEGGEEGERGGPKVPDLLPSEDLLSRVVGGGSVDKLDNVDDDEVTALNSKRWKHAPFFNRLKRQVAQNWHPQQVYMARDPNGNVYGFKDRKTVVRVKLRPNGTVAGIYVVEGSGIDFLDDEAVRAFRAAGPFPNPPAGLVDAETKLITFSFGFYFEIGGGRGRWKIRRQW